MAVQRVHCQRIADAAPIVDVSIVLPCLNEERSVGACVQQAYAGCAAVGLHAEVIVVDNGSTDCSVDAATRAGARIVDERIRGYGAALAAGIRAARGEIVVMADADLTYPLDRVGELVAPLQVGSADLVLGARLEQTNRQSMPILHRLVGTPMLTLLIRQGTGLPGISDSQSGFRAFRRETILNLGLRSTGMEFASEMLVRASRASLRVTEVSLGYRPRVGESKLRAWTDGWRHVRLIAGLSPPMLLWYPGLALVLASLIGFWFSFGTGAGPVGSATWQPLFFSPTMLIFGLASLLAASVLGYHLPSSPSRVKDRFAWIAAPTFRRLSWHVGAWTFLAGACIDIYLFVAAIRHMQILVHDRIALAGLSQALMLSGILLLVFAALYRVLTEPVGG